MCNFTIKSMNEKDWPMVSKIYSEALLKGHSTFQIDCPTYEEWDTSHLSDCRFVICNDKGTVVGWCCISATSKRNAYKGVVETSIYIDDEYHGKGLGTQLLTTLVKEASAKGYYSFYAAIFSNNTGSIKLYEKCGFRKIGYRERIAQNRFGQWQDTVLYEKRV